MKDTLHVKWNLMNSETDEDLCSERRENKSLHILSGVFSPTGRRNNLALVFCRFKQERNWIFYALACDATNWTQFIWLPIDIFISFLMSSHVCPVCLLQRQMLSIRIGIFSSLLIAATYRHRVRHLSLTVFQFQLSYMRMAMRKNVPMCLLFQEWNRQWSHNAVVALSMFFIKRSHTRLNSLRRGCVSLEHTLVADSDYV